MENLITTNGNRCERLQGSGGYFPILLGVGRDSRRHELLWASEDMPLRCQERVPSTYVMLALHLNHRCIIVCKAPPCRQAGSIFPRVLSPTRAIIT